VVNHKVPGSIHHSFGEVIQLHTVEKKTTP
jgi:hypothetical protein